MGVLECVYTPVCAHVYMSVPEYVPVCAHVHWVRHRVATASGITFLGALLSELTPVKLG